MNQLYYDCASKYLTDNNQSVPVGIDEAITAAISYYLTSNSVTVPRDINSLVVVACHKYLSDNSADVSMANIDTLMYLVANKYLELKSQTIPSDAFNTIYNALVYFATNGAGSGGGPVYSPSLDFSDARNSQYIALLFNEL